MNEVLKCIKEGITTRIFKPEQIKEEELQAIIEAGLYAPSGINKQPWHFTVIQNRDLIDEMNFEIKEVDCAVATQNMLLGAHSLGIASCWYAAISMPFSGGKKEEIISKLNIPENYTPFYAELLGYSDNTPSKAPK